MIYIAHVLFYRQFNVMWFSEYIQLSFWLNIDSSINVAFSNARGDLSVSIMTLLGGENTQVSFSFYIVCLFLQLPTVIDGERKVIL